MFNVSFPVPYNQLSPPIMFNVFHSLYRIITFHLPQCLMFVMLLKNELVSAIFASSIKISFPSNRVTLEFLEIFFPINQGDVISRTTYY